MKHRDLAITFDCAGNRLVGVLSAPEVPSDTAVVVVVGGPQYRVGSHRQFVRLARSLATHGYPVLRFDCRGMGDSSGAPPGFDDLDADIAAAIDIVISRAGVRRIVLWGLCDGASAALMYWQASRDPRVTGLIVLNPWVRSEASVARAEVKHYYAQRLMQRAFWAKLIRGRVAASALGDLARSAAVALRNRPSATVPGLRPPFQHRMAEGWHSFPGRILLLLSGRDLTAREFVEQVKADVQWRGALNSARVQHHDLPEADHTFSDKATAAKVEVLTLQWLDAMKSGGQAMPMGPRPRLAWIMDGQ